MYSKSSEGHLAWPDQNYTVNPIRFEQKCQARSAECFIWPSSKQISVTDLYPRRKSAERMVHFFFSDFVKHVIDKCQYILLMLSLYINM